jgi:hypothetical protein
MAHRISQAALALNFPEGRRARGPDLPSAMTPPEEGAPSSITAWWRCSRSAWRVSAALSVKNGCHLLRSERNSAQRKAR